MINIRIAIDTIRDLGKQRIQLIRKKHPQISGFFLLKSIAFDFISGFVKLMASRYYLRGSELGKWVSVNGKPIIVNKGRISIGNNVQIWSKIEKTKMIVMHGATLVIGDNSFINGVHISTSVKIEIGKNVRIGPYTILMDDDFHDVYDHASTGKKAPIIIEDDVWIATRVVILKGVTIGRGAVIATGAVVTRSVEPYSIVGGVPARRIK